MSISPLHTVSLGKYPWGNMCVSYDSLSDTYALTNDPFVSGYVVASLPAQRRLGVAIVNSYNSFFDTGYHCVYL